MTIEQEHERKFSIEVPLGIHAFRVPEPQKGVHESPSETSKLQLGLFAIFHFNFVK